MIEVGAMTSPLLPQLFEIAGQRDCTCAEVPETRSNERKVPTKIPPSIANGVHTWPDERGSVPEVVHSVTEATTPINVSHRGQLPPTVAPHKCVVIAHRELVGDLHDVDDVTAQIALRRSPRTCAHDPVAEFGYAANPRLANDQRAVTPERVGRRGDIGLNAVGEEAQRLPPARVPNALRFCCRGVRRSRASQSRISLARLRRAHAPVSSKRGLGG